MNKLLKISQIVRKRIAIVLLLNFFVSTVLVGFAHNECNGMCSLDSDSHKCSDNVEMSCCDMMNLDSNTSACGMEVAENSCDYELTTIDNFISIIPKSVDIKITLTELSSSNCNFNQYISNSFILSQNFIPDISPPIYLAVSSFII